MKHLKRFNESISYESECWKNAKIGDILSDDVIYQYVKSLHRNEEDFYDGDLEERIYQFSKYKLMEVNISKINIDEYDLFLKILYYTKLNLNKVFKCIINTTYCILKCIRIMQTFLIRRILFNFQIFIF